VTPLMSDLPPPLTPPDCDLRDFPRMMIDVTRLRQSDFDAIIDDTAWRAGMNLWFSAWHGDPAGSLSSDDSALAKAAGLGRDLRTWSKVRTDALRGFTLCSDGRLYHATVCEFALEAWLEKLVQRLSSGAGNAKRWGADFDPAAIEAEIDAAADMLAALNPQSRAIAKAKRRHSRRNPDGNPDGTRPPPGGSPEPPILDRKGKGQGKGIEEEVPLANANGADETAIPPLIDPEKVMFDQGIALLGEGSVPEGRARPIIGRWKRDYGAEAVIVALGKAKREGAIDPVSFIEGCLKNGGKNGPRSGGRSAWGAARDRNRVLPGEGREPLLEQLPRPG